MHGFNYTEEDEEEELEDMPFQYNNPQTFSNSRHEEEDRPIEKKAVSQYVEVQPSSMADPDASISSSFSQFSLTGKSQRLPGSIRNSRQHR